MGNNDEIYSLGLPEKKSKFEISSGLIGRRQLAKCMDVVQYVENPMHLKC